MLDASFPRRAFLRNSLLLAVPVVLGGTTFSASAAPKAFNPSSRARGDAWINVRDRGAYGNGSHDDTTAIQNAIDALPSGGGTVYIPDGDYVVDPARRIKLRSRMHLKLAPGAKLIAKANAKERAYVLMFWRIHDVEVSGGQIVGDRDRHLGSTGEWGHGMMVLGSSRITIRDIRISKCWGDGISVSGANLRNGKAPIPCEDVVVANIVSTGNRRQGMSIGGVNGMKVYDSEFSDTHGTAPECGIDIEPDVGRTGHAEDVRIENCLLLNNRGNGIQVYRRCFHTIIRDCLCKFNNGYGILAIGSTGGYIARNRLWHNGLHGLGIRAKSKDFQISGNYMRNNYTRYLGRHGVSETWGGTDWTAMRGFDLTWITRAQVDLNNVTNIRFGKNFYSR